jgi:hypothetical protein
MKLVILVLCCISLNSVFSQNKKEQIIELNKSLDSLKSIVSKDSVLIYQKNIEINHLLKTVNNNQSEISNLKNEFERLNEKYKFNEQTILDLKNKIELSEKKNRLSNCVVFKSNKKIKGFDLDIIFYPEESFDLDDKLYRGYTVFNFSKSGKVFPFKFDSFPLSLYSAKNIKFSEDSTQVLDCPYQEIIVELDSLPISFKDFNFDNVDELIITETKGGQRSMDLYLPFQITDNSIEDVSNWVRDEFFDEETEFNTLKKQIQFYASNGINQSYSNLYQAIFENGNFVYFKFIKKIPY